MIGIGRTDIDTTTSIPDPTLSSLSVHDQIREPKMILLTMGFKTDDFLDQPFKTQNHFRNDPRRVHTSFERSLELFFGG